MQGSRPARVGDQIREELSELLTRDVKDPGIGFITITHVKVSADLQVARAFYTILGDAAARKATAKALDRATPFLRRQVAARVRLRRAPELVFQYDESIERHQRIEEILQEIKAAERPAVDEPGDGDAAAAAAANGGAAGDSAGEAGSHTGDTSSPGGEQSDRRDGAND